MKYLVVGCGLSGVVVARYLAEHGQKVEVWDRRNHIAGNMYDYVDEHGILIHKYGPHTFHTKEKYLADYMKRWGEWSEYKLQCQAYFCGKFTPAPFNFQTIDDYYTAEDAAKLKKHIKAYFGDRKSASVLDVMNASDDLISSYGKFLFEHDYSLYTAKQWGISASEVDPSVLKRVPLIFSYETGYFDDEFQMMPKTSFADIFSNMLNHENIAVRLGIEALEHLAVDIENNTIMLDGEICPYTVIYTGALDELFGADMGALPYRSLRFEWHHENKLSIQPAAVVAYPEAEGYTRIVEFNKLPVQNVQGTTYEIEYPLVYQPDAKQEPYYPLLTYDSQILADKYKTRADRINGFYYCGRLADFKYYNMDQALKRALDLCKDIL